MIESVFRGADVPATDRFESWREQMRQSAVPAELSTDHTSEFWGRRRLVALDDVHVCAMECAPLRVRRTPHLVRRSDPELYQLTLPLRGGLDVARVDRRIGPHDWYLHDTSRPYDITLGQGVGEFAAVEAKIPKSGLPLPPDRVNRVLGRRISGREGIGALLADVLIRLATDAGSYQPSDAPRLATVLLDLVSALFANLLDVEVRLPPETRRRALTRRIQTFIDLHLHNAHLTPSDVAAAHHISTSYLHRLFQDEDATVAAWIRHRRLERARDDLADPALRTVPVHRIAARSGFTHPATFTRAFRATYGISPTEHRNQA